MVGFDIASSRLAVALAQRYPELRAAVGIHPHESKFLDAEALTALRELTQQPEVVAIGEIGLDFHYEYSPREAQREAFRRQLALAGELALPIIIHEREAADELLALLDAAQGRQLGGNWHCCSLTPGQGVEIARDFFIGIAGWITFPKAENIRALARAIPLERLLVETDSPYLAPVPFRGRPNTPAHVRVVAQALATVKEVSLARIEEITISNTLRAFPRWALKPQ